MVVIDFIWYCISCMMTCISAVGGHLPEDFTWKEILIGVATLLVIILILALIVWLISLIGKKHK